MEKISDYECHFTSVTVEDDSSTVNMEANNARYGKVYISLTLKAGSVDGNSGSYSSNARAISESGDLIRGSSQGIWKKDGKLVHLKGLGSASNGDLTLSDGTLDLIEKTLKASQYEAWS